MSEGSVSEGLAVGIDIGGTKIAAGVVDTDGRVLARQELPTPTADRSALIDAIVGAARSLAADWPVVAVGIGVAGLVDASGAIVRSATYLPLENEPLRDVIAAAVELPVVVDNDANTGGWAEARFGAARGVRDALFVAIGTGIGGAIIVDRVLSRGWQGSAGEIGHLIVERDGRPCPCGSRGCWEQYASGRALVAAAENAGLTVEHGATVTAAAQAGDARARDLLSEIGGWIGIGMASLVAVLDPEVVVLGGGLSAAGDLLMEPAEAAFLANLTAHGRRPEPSVVLAALGPDAGLIGAADLARG